MLRPRYALLASVICFCSILAVGVRPTRAQIISPIPSCAIPKVLTSDPLAPIHTCALPPGYSNAPMQSKSLMLIESAGSRLLDRLASNSTLIWESVLDSLTNISWTSSDQNLWANRGAADHRVILRNATAQTASASKVTRSAPSECPLAFLLTSPMASQLSQRPQSAASAVLTSASDLLADFETPLTMSTKLRSQRSLQSGSFTLRSVEATPGKNSLPGELVSNQISRAEWNGNLLRTRPAPVPMSNVARNSTRVDELAGWNLFGGADWWAANLETLQQRIDETVELLIETEGPIRAPGLSDPGRPRIGEKLSRLVATPAGPVVMRQSLSSIQRNFVQSLPPGEIIRPTSVGSRKPSAITRNASIKAADFDGILKLASAANPLRPWYGWSKEVSRNAFNQGLEIASNLDDWQAIPSVSLPPLPAILVPESTLPKVRNVSATRDAQAQQEIITPATSKPAPAMEFPPRQPLEDGCLDMDWWKNYACPCDRAVEEFERRSTKPNVLPVALPAAAERMAPSQMMGNIFGLLKNKRDLSGNQVAMQLNEREDGLATQRVTRARGTGRMANLARNARLGLAAGYRPAEPKAQPEMRLSLAELEFVKAASHRLGLATNRVTQGFQEAAVILVGNLDERANPHGAIDTFVKLRSDDQEAPKATSSRLGTAQPPAQSNAR